MIFRPHIRELLKIKACFQPRCGYAGAARNIEEGGSLTILATALVDTGSRMDVPAIDIHRSGTRKDELLLDKIALSRIWVLRKVMSPLSPVESIELLIDRLSKARTNADFWSSMKG